MKLSLHWLASYFIDKPDWNEVWHKLTAAGIEIESKDPVAPMFSGVFVANVVDCKIHPDADKLKICSVDIGSGTYLQIICGAANVATGVKVPCAVVGAVLPNGMKITERKMRGTTSFGMLCSATEIGLQDDVDGLLLLPNDAPIGMPVREYLDLDDQIIEFKITPNRGDCLSVLGLTREISALTGYRTDDRRQRTKDRVQKTEDRGQNSLLVQIDEQEKCPNYTALVIKGINNQAVLPIEMERYLNRSGIKSISPVVDITNFVMLELGQPLHAFDLAHIGNKLQVRLAKTGESLNLLDGKVAKLDTNTLVICDEKNQPVAIAGVMGGSESGVKSNTCDIILEAAFFVPEIIAARAKQYGVNSDSAMRFERGVDYLLPHKAISYAAELITKFCGGEIGAVNQVKSAISPSSKEISLEYKSIDHLIGVSIAPKIIDEFLQKLGFGVESGGEKLVVTPPSYRFDITRKEDIIEEIARSYGYDNIEPIMPTIKCDLAEVDNEQLKIQQLKQLLVSLGFSEIVSYAFLSEKHEAMMGNSAIKPIRLRNSIANLQVMRTSLIADLVQTLKHNLGYGHKQMRLFEVAKVFYGTDELSQPLKLSGLVYGNRNLPNALDKDELADFYDVKHVVELLLSQQNDLQFILCQDYSVLHSGRCAKIYSGNNEVGIIGQLAPKICQELSLPEAPYLFELDILQVIGYATDFTVKEIKKFPKVERDLAFVVDDSVAAGAIIDLIRKSKIDNLSTLYVFDVYKIDKTMSRDNALTQDTLNKKSIAINFTFQANKTLTDNEIKKSIDDITRLVSSKFSAELRC